MIPGAIKKVKKCHVSQKAKLTKQRRGKTVPLPLRKNGTKTVPLGYYCYKWYPFSKRYSFFLNNHVPR